MMTDHRIIFGDAREMTGLADESVHFVVTSPPYWCIKDYGHPEQIGREQPYEDYIEALSQRLIKMYSFWGETVLDPFMGSGTTALAAAMKGRNSAGYEIDPEFEPIIGDKLDSLQPSLFDAVGLRMEFSHARLERVGT